MKRSERGSFLLTATIVTVTVAGVAALLLSLSLMVSRASGASVEAGRALNLAEAALAHALEELRTGKDSSNDGVGSVRGSAADGSFSARAARMDGGLWVIRARGEYRGVRRGIEAVVGPSNANPSAWAVFGDSDVRLDSNAQIDSYDSTTGERRRSGHVGSNGNIRLDSNARILGDAYAGPEGQIRLDSHAVVDGSSGNLSERITLPRVTLPAGFESFPDWGCSPDFRLGSNRRFSVGPGSYRLRNLRLDSNTTLTLSGPMTIVVDELRVDSNSRIDILRGPVKIYATNRFELDSNATMNNVSRKPADLQILLTIDNRADTNPNLRVKVDSNSRLYGVVYAPTARVRLDSNSEIFGSVTGSSVDIDSNMRVHYDESLATAMRNGDDLGVLSWREIALQ